MRNLSFPILGWAMQMGNYIFLARKWEKDKPWLEECFKYYKNLSYGGQFLLFPEGNVKLDIGKILILYAWLVWLN